jgi:mycoredoxin-dependent peroxiredoxin
MTVHETDQPTTGPSIGRSAPDFTLRDQHGQDVALSSFRGESAVLIVFYPFAFSRICRGELGEIRDDLVSLASEGVQAVAISCDPVYTLRAWAEAEGYDFPLLSDFWPHGEVARAYGVFNERTGAALRGSFLVDIEGVLRWSVVSGTGQARDTAEYRQAVAAL